MEEQKTTWRTEDAVEGGFRDVKKIRGRIVSMVRETGSITRDGVERSTVSMRISMEDAEVLETISGDPAVALEDSKFGFWHPYSNNKVSLWIQGFLTSAEEMGFALPDDIGSDKVVVLEKKETILLDPKTGDPLITKEGEQRKGTNFVFIEAEGVGGSSEELVDYVIDKIVGRTPVAATRAVALDPKCKGNKEIVSSVKDGSFALAHGVKVVKGVYKV